MHLRSFIIASLSLSIATGCVFMNKDSDEDGLLDKEEEELGTDPTSADTDGDGISDFDEVNDGMDPTSDDSDGDGYKDNWELTEGTDPTDADSVIYEGGWPYNPDKDDMESVSWSDAELSADAPAPRFTYVDQYGDEVDFYDFAYQGKPIMLDIAAMWCGPCHSITSWVSGNGDTGGWGSYWPSIEEGVANGDIIWVTILDEDEYGNAPDESDIERWVNDYPDEIIPVLAGTGEANSAYVQLGWPTVVLINEDMTVAAYPGAANHYKALDAAEDYISGL